MRSPSDRSRVLGHASEATAADIDAAFAAAKAAQPAWDDLGGAARAPVLRSHGRRPGGQPRPPDRHLRARGRQDPGRRRRRGARGGRLLPLLRPAGRDAVRRPRDPDRPGRRDQPAAAARPRRLRLHQPVELPAGHLHRPDRRRAGRRQRRPGQARRADAADRRRGGAAVPRRRPRSRACWPCCPATARRSARRWSATPGLDGVAFTGGTDTAWAINRTLAAAPGPDRAVHRRDRRAQRHVRRHHRAARTGHRRRDRLGLRLGRPALLGAAHPVRAPRHRRQPDRGHRRAPWTPWSSAIRPTPPPTSAR